MKELVKKNFPLFFNFLKNIYRSTPYYKNKIEKLRKIQEANQLKQEKEQEKIMYDVFNNDYTVHNGLFKGMKYIKRSSGSALLPKILGSYEEPIQEWLREVIEEKKYKSIIDIGCAEGYYACGFAIRMPQVKIMAYDIDEQARANSTELKELNGLQNIEIRVECTHQELNTQSKPNTLVFCDIEGFEKVLLDPIKAPNLKYVDLIVEAHDCYIPNITEELISRFHATHKIRINVDYPFRVNNNYQTPNIATQEQMKYITNESRPPAMNFIYMENVNEKI